MVWGDEGDLKTAVEEVKIRLIDATNGVPPETRQVFPDGTNDFERILPGPNRMYPDTDSPPTTVTEEYLESIRKNLPEQLWEREKRLEALNLPRTLAKSLAISRYLNLFEKIIKHSDINPTLVAVTLEERIRALRRAGKNVDTIPHETLFYLFQKLDENRFVKDAIPTVLEFLADNPGKTVDEAIVALDIKPVSTKELENIVDKAIAHYSNPININRSIRIIMADVMKVVRNRIDSKIVKEVITAKFENSLK